MMNKPPYYEALWHNCTKCRIHFMSEQPQLKAYLCDACWDEMPKYRVNKEAVKRQQYNKMLKKKREDNQYTTIGAILYILGCTICILIIGYYLWVK
tara:strand:+ start:155 stop:442 length:288 start_codon:yes stop_codon:yes gene_type:complete